VIFQASTAVCFTQTLSFDGCTACTAFSIRPRFLLHILARQAHGHNCTTDSIRQWKKRGMAGLQRSAQTFRRSGSSGLVWDERYLTEEQPCAGGACAVRQPELRHSRSVGSLGMLRRQGRDDGGGVDDKKRRERSSKSPSRGRITRIIKRGGRGRPGRRSGRGTWSRLLNRRRRGCPAASSAPSSEVNGVAPHRRSEQGSGNGMNRETRTF
jgi:hypothetical protein